MLWRSDYVRIGVLCFGALLDSFGYSLLLNVLPSFVDISDSLHYKGAESLSPGTDYSVLLFTFVSGTTIFPLFVGRWSDSIGRRPLLLCSLLVLLFTNLAQAFTQSFWVLATLRFFSGASGCLRPLAIAYIADMIADETTRGWCISSLSLMSAFSVGLGPVIGAVMVESDRSYPFLFMSMGSGACLLLAYFCVPEVRRRRFSVTATSLKLKSREMSGIYVSLLILAFSTYFMSMMASIAFPLSLKESFGLSPLLGGLCSIVDGPFIFISNFFFMHYLTPIPKACKASIVASLVFCIIAMVPLATGNHSLFLFLLLKYLTSLAAPVVFSAIPQILINNCPQNVCGRFAGLLTFFHGSGRLTATALVGPLFALDPQMVYYSVALIGFFSAFVFVLLYKDLLLLKVCETKGDDLGNPFLSRRDSIVLSATSTQYSS